MTRFILVNRYFQPDESATSQLLTDLAHHLASHHDVLVLTSRQLLEHARTSLPATETLGRLQIHRLWSTAWGRQWLPGRLLDYVSFLGAVAAWLLLHSRRGDVVLAKTDPPLLGVATTVATLGRQVKRIQWLQDLYPETAARLGVISDDGFAARVVRAVRNWSLRHSDLVVAVSAGMLTHLRDSAGRAALVHIPNWANDLGPAPGPGTGDGALTVGYSGNLGRAHPIEGLLQLAEIATDPAVQFLFTGGGIHHDRLATQVRQLGLTNWAFLPYQPRDQLGALLRRSDLHLVILDPRVEQFIFPSKVYGILSAGRPILHLGDTGGEVAKLLREHRCGWSLPADSGAQILALLRQLQGSPEMLHEAGRQARTAYDRHYSRAGTLKQWDEALRRV